MALSPLTLGLIGAGVGLAKDRLFDQPAFRAQAEVEGLKTAYGPLLGTQGNIGPRPSGLQSALDFGLTGATAGMALQNNAAKNQALKAFGANQTAQAAATKAIPNVTSNAPQPAFSQSLIQGPTPTPETIQSFNAASNIGSSGNFDPQNPLTQLPSFQGINAFQAVSPLVRPNAEMQRREQLAPFSTRMGGGFR